MSEELKGTFTFIEQIFEKVNVPHSIHFPANARNSRQAERKHCV